MQKVREAAARISCCNNLKQIALAAHSYDSAVGHLPPGMTGIPPGYPGSSQNGNTCLGTLAYLLPYMEQGNIYNQIPSIYWSNPAGAGVWWGGASGTAQNHVKSFVCPADNPYAETQGIWAFLYPYNYTLYGGYFAGAGYQVGATNYASNAGALGNDSVSGDTFYGQWVGPYYQDSAVAISQISDGTSQTIAFGETLGGTNQGARDFYLPWMGAANLPTAWDLTQPSAWYTYGSKHDAGIVNFAMCDGSVRNFRTIGPNADFFAAHWYAFMAVSGYQDGNVVDYTQLN